MNAKVIIAVLVLVAVAAGGYLLMKPTPTVQPEPTGEEPTALDADTPEDEGSFTGSMQALAMRGGSYKCEISQANGTPGLSKSTVYVDGGKMRTDYTTVIEGQGEMEGSMIADSEWVYTWSSQSPQGMKLKAMAPVDGNTNNTTPTGNPMGMNGMDAEYAWDCDPWTADVSVFTPPSTVTFMEFTAPSMPPMQ